MPVVCLHGMFSAESEKRHFEIDGNPESLHEAVSEFVEKQRESSNKNGTDGRNQGRGCHLKYRQTSLLTRNGPA
jgi:hypothetical protein